ncbi:hypothetical protein FPOAC2_11920 [Fusarium poae]
MPGNTNFFLPPNAPPSSPFDTKQLQTVIQVCETSNREQQLNDHQFTQLQTLTEIAESTSSPAIDPGAVPEKRSSGRDSTRASQSHTPSRSQRRSKNVPQNVCFISFFYVVVT